MGELFEALHDLHFSPGVHAGTDYIAALVAEKTGARVALVHLYDINRGEFVVASAIGARADALLDWSTPEEDPIVAEALANVEAIGISDPEADARLRRDRWALIEPRRSVICAPVLREGRYLGLIEVVDPIDGDEFTETDRNAMTYVAGALATFLSERGIVLSEPSMTGMARPLPPPRSPGPEEE